MSPLVLRGALYALPFIACRPIDLSVSSDTAESHFQFAAPLQIYFGFAISRLSIQNQAVSGHLTSSNRNPLQLVWKMGLYRKQPEASYRGCGQAKEDLDQEMQSS